MLSNIQKNTSITPISAPIPAQTSSNHAQSFADNINAISQLPPETIQKIAFNLDSDSYSQLRATCKRMLSVLPSINDIEESLSKGISGQLKKDYSSVIFGNSIQEQFLNTEKRNLAQILKCCHVITSPDNLTLTTIQILYLEKDFTHSEDKNGKILQRCAKEIYRVAKGTIPPSSSDLPSRTCGYGKTISSLFTENTRMISLDIDMAIKDLSKNLSQAQKTEAIESLTKEKINFVFKSLNNVFSTSQNNEKWLVAISAEKLKNHWHTTPPNGIPQDDITQISSQYSKLFSQGKNILSFLESIK
ncbi:hypothetical protein [Providencia manganoxydans]|uniref:hypothetical protein n=1 Tax=Providencia manganoxydans TaxID=2923283 RepID=UPI00280F1EF8|nr:hypothetical protein [Providencia stuartii]ELR5082025.1 hypothetical protein [Providencia stuartii]